MSSDWHRRIQKFRIQKEVELGRGVYWGIKGCADPPAPHSCQESDHHLLELSHIPPGTNEDPLREVLGQLLPALVSELSSPLDSLLLLLQYFLLF